MAKKVAAKKSVAAPRQKPSALVDPRVVYSGDNLEQLAKLPDACVDFAHCLPRVLKSIRQITPLTARQIRINVVQQKICPALFQFSPESVRLAPFLRRDAKAVLEIF